VYVPDIYQPPEPAWNSDLIRRFPLAVLLTSGPERPFATHLPAILADDFDGAPVPAGLAGGQIYGHLNRRNPHWAALVSGSPATLIFTGPHGYVSPAVYEFTPAAPTWNFTAVHVHGILRRIETQEDTMRVVSATARTLEARLGAGWDMNGSTGYFQTLLPGVGAFVLDIQSVDGMFKMSQEQKPAVRHRVSGAFSKSPRGLHRELAGLMDHLYQPVNELHEGRTHQKERHGAAHQDL
jgi:predicted FMN-binding regulatory protein PaiB